MSLLSLFEIDRFGSVNLSELDVRPHVIAGAGGFVDITARAKEIVFPVISPPAPGLKSATEE